MFVTEQQTWMDLWQYQKTNLPYIFLLLSLIALLYTIMRTYNKYLFERYISEVKLEDRNWLYSNFKNYFLDITFPKVRKDLPIYYCSFPLLHCSISLKNSQYTWANSAGPIVVLWHQLFMKTKLLSWQKHIQTAVLMLQWSTNWTLPPTQEHESQWDLWYRMVKLRGWWSH